jgi:hypothetical protein
MHLMRSAGRAKLRKFDLSFHFFLISPAPVIDAFAILAGQFDEM